MSLPIPRALLACLLLATPAFAQWQHPLSLDGGGWWRGRIRVTIDNGRQRPAVGEPVAVPIGSGPGQAELAGQSVQSLRLCSEEGVELLFAVQGPNGNPMTRGTIPAQSLLLLPAECEAGKTAAYLVYFDNPDAAEVPDFLSAQVGLINGDVEQGEGPAPAGWAHDAADPQHQATWSTEKPQSGTRCLKTVVAAGAEPTWIATRQHGIRIAGGARYRMRAWVRAENVQGSAGWYIHVGSQEKPMLISPMLHAGQGTFDWKQVSAEFTAPAEAVQADLGTVLRGCGTAWFDNVTLECLDPSLLRAVAAKPERMTLREIGRPSSWYSEAGATFDHRAVVRVFNFQSRPLERAVVCVDGAMFEARSGGRPQALRVVEGGTPIACWSLGSLLLFPAERPPRSVRDYCVYWSSDPRGPALPGPSPASSLGTLNLVKNPGFELGQGTPQTVENWTCQPAGKAPDVAFRVDEPRDPQLGRRCAKMEVPHGVRESWRGWHQSVPVRPGATYLLAAWVKCQDIRGGEVRVHVHLHTASGQLCKQGAMTGIGPGIGGTTGWTRMSGLLTMPEDAASLAIHLTTNTTGTVWHDGIVAAEVTPGRIAQVEGLPLETAKVEVWPVPAITKVFPEDSPPRARADAVRISAARNEQEPLQLAIRSGRAIPGVRVEVEPPAGPNGARLKDVEVQVVGYVPIDQPTNYYQSLTPAWHRKVPAQAAACDGWAGRWPDPLLPRDTFDLAANATQPVWITVSVPASPSVATGDYAGKVRFVAAGRTLAETPFTVHVWDFTLPEERHVAAIYDVRATGGEKLWGQSGEALERELFRFMARRRLCADSIRPFPSIKYENGRATADFTAFDKAAAWYFDELKFPFSYTPWYFYLFGWGMPPGPHFGQQPYPGEPPFEGADRSQLRPEFKRAYQACLKLFWDHVREKGWEKRFVLYISDEPFDTQPHIRAQMKALCAMIHEVDPRIPIYCSTWKHVPDWDGSLNIWGIGHYGVVPVEQIAKLRQAGDRIWWTTDGQMCTDTPHCAVERLLPHYCFKYGAEAYEFWGVAWLTYDPYRFGWHAYIHQSDQPGKSYWIRYPNGDGFLVYPGAPIGHAGPVSSIRLEQARDGVEDFEYLYRLRQLAATAKAHGKSAEVAEQALRQADRLVTIPNAGGKYSTKILPNPAELYRVREALAKAIEALGR